MTKFLVIVLIACGVTQDVCGMQKIKSAAKLMQQSKRSFNVDRWNNKVNKTIEGLPMSMLDVIGVGMTAGSAIGFGCLFRDEKSTGWRAAGVGYSLLVGLAVEIPLGRHKKYPRGLTTIVYPVLYGASLAWFKKSK